MRATRYELNLYSFYDHTGMERHFEKMAAKGWMIEKLGGLWRYRRCEPRRLRFCVAYYPEASEYDPAAPSEGEQTFWDYCASAGWQRAAYRAQTHAFFNEDEDAVPIETEAAVQVETLHRAAKKEYLFSLWALLALSALQIVMWGTQLSVDLIGVLSSTTLLFSAATYPLLLLVCTCALARYYRWHRKAVRAAEELGRFTPTHSHRLLSGAAIVMALAVFAGLLLGTGENLPVYLFAMCAIFGVMALTFGVKALLRRKNVEAITAKIVTGIAAGVFTLLCVALMGYGAFHDWFERVPENVEPYEYSYQYGRGEVYTAYAYHDPLPLYVEELTETDYDRYSCERAAQSSPFLAKTKYDQETRRGDWGIDAPELHYIVYEVKCAPLFDPCLDELLNEYADRAYSAFRYRAVDAAPWGADAAYRLYDSDDNVDFNTWILTYGTRIVVLGVSAFTLDETDIALIGARLGA